MREICTSGSEGGVAQTNAPSLPPINGEHSASRLSRPVSHRVPEPREQRNERQA